VALLLTLIWLSACSSSHPLAPTPNVFAGPGGYPAQGIAPQFQTSEPELIYVTDRKTEQNRKGGLAYGSKRSSIMVAGKILVHYGKDMSWDRLIRASETRHRKKKVILEVARTTEVIKFPATPLPFGMKDGKIVMLEPGASQYAKAEAAFQDMVTTRLGAARRKEIILFVHGFNNRFDEAGLALADLWHFSGRVGVPIFYSWPAASGGFFGYFKDREAGEFSVFHLKQLFRMLSRTKGLEKIHVIAHSRGTDIVTTALRELIIDARAAGIDPYRKYKIANLFLAAPDMDFGVVGQRLIAEKFGPAFGQITVYMNKGDNALSFSQLLMSGLRFGRLDSGSLTIQERKIFDQVKNVNFIDVKGVKSFFGHDYYRTSPGVLSDIAVTIRDGARPGSDSRPLIRESGNFWALPKGYLLGK